MEKREQLSKGPQKLIVAWAFQIDDDGELQPAFDPREMRSEEQAITAAAGYFGSYDGAIAWVRDAQPDIGEYGEARVIFQAGLVPDLE
ncbi:hypothetical protein [Pelagibacterium sp.]|uniref:hypothetical protein n=1 Tax=Pelagibacterium sp. TaxID=1967288 RepID=UPI003A8EA1E1